MKPKFWNPTIKPTNESPIDKNATDKIKAVSLKEFKANVDSYAILDIGGGSVEAFVSVNSQTYARSFQLGAVRLLNKDKGYKEHEMNSFGNWLKQYAPVKKLYGLGGNLRAIFEANNHSGALSSKEFTEFVKEYNSVSKKDLIEKFSIPKDRIDIIPLAAEIYELSLASLNCNVIENSFWSISDGLFKQILNRNL